MNEKPGLEETIRDIEITEKELKAYNDITIGFFVLADLPDQLPANAIRYRMQARHYEQLSVKCSEFLTKLEKYKNQLEEQNAKQ